MHFDTNTISKLSFPDFIIENMKFDPAQQKLSVALEGAWLDFDEGHKLGKGIITIDSWKEIHVRTYNSQTDSWTIEDPRQTDVLRDLCEVKYGESSVTLYGFGKMHGLWMEWQFIHPVIYADFEEH